jgi:hypothetical protein
VTVAGGPSWQAPVAEATSARQASAAPTFSAVSWWFVAWRARVHERSTGNIEARLSAIADALAQLDTIAGQPGMHPVGQAGVSFDFWFEARTEREAAGGARVALRQACRAAGVGDPTPPSSREAVDVMLMFEEVPTLRRDHS